MPKHADSDEPGKGESATSKALRDSLETLNRNLAEGVRTAERLQRDAGRLVEESARLAAELFEQRRAMELLRDRLHRAEDRRAAREEELRRAHETAERADRAKARFLTAASHDLRQPIQAAALYAHILRGAIGSNPSAREAADLLQASIDNLSGMLSSLLDLARLEAGAVDVAVTEFRPDALMRRLAQEFRESATTEGTSLHVYPCGLAVRTDPRLLERILTHLLSNAIRHGGGNGRRVLLGCRRRPGALEFQVWDDGRGIPPDARAAIFEEFHQLDNPERSAAKGFGLGLPLVARMARLLGLTLDLRSQVGRGTVFMVTVPRAALPPDPDRRLTAAARAMAAAATSVAAASPTDRMRGRRVLLVEDDERVRHAMTMLLKRWGVQVIAVGSVEELAARLPRMRSRPHVVLADHRLPGGQTGRTVAELVRSRWDVPVVIITGDTAPERLREARSIGCRLLHKPVEPADLATTLGDVMDS
ncbi:ATP-binding response regulator [Azospirillum brasilense]|uniref:ATP-binding response regulator n=1 Tax=Azospirillum brasilense TaxID=192 RepID=UPI000E696091|nr:hybrid sensor histidine kinase/response regulator [Azospirillum brasilense]NUB28019.1 response regulator [Azospirillum brasilense]NUB31004.1 response regulator [Azospirillum brasilense]RIW02418.1 hybrid sensor histidine kinase/response regulator [Azospirillum brasilense]